MAQQLAFGAIALTAHGGKAAAKETKEKIEKLLQEGVKSVVTHEVGHTLGLRHNFIASTYLTMDEVNDPEKTRDVGLAASIMDYVPVNISPEGEEARRLFQPHDRPLRLLGD